MKPIPVNDEHSILNVGFSMTLNREIDYEDIKNFAVPYQVIAEKLPHQKVINDPANFGVQFKYLRPDGTAVWFLSIVNDTIEILCTRYTRWAEIWGQSSRYMSLVAESLSKNSSIEQTQFRNLSLKVVDVFLASDSRDESDRIFSKNDYIALETLRHSRAWNSDNGWFYDFGDDAVLNKLSISSKVDNNFKQNKDVEVQWIYELSHFQEHRGEFKNIENFGDVAPQIMEHFHSSNKSMLSSVLSNEAQQLVKLHGK